jgi:hypothetical protein
MATGSRWIPVDGRAIDHQELDAAAARELAVR